jgi:hypothetical protein
MAGGRSVLVFRLVIILIRSLFLNGFVGQSLFYYVYLILHSLQDALRAVQSIFTFADYKGTADPKDFVYRNLV